MRSDTPKDPHPKQSDAVDASAVAAQPPEAISPARQEGAGLELIVPSPPESGRSATSAPAVRPNAADQADVHVTPNLLPLITGRLASPEAQKQRELNAMVHRMLVIGLGASTTLMLIGLVLDLALGRAVPTQTPGLSESLQRIGALRPSGFLTLGMLVLIATPVLGVIGSIFAFLSERDWRYAAITGLVFAVVAFSLMTGQG